MWTARKSSSGAGRDLVVWVFVVIVFGVVVVVVVVTNKGSRTNILSVGGGGDDKQCGADTTPIEEESAAFDAVVIIVSSPSIVKVVVLVVQQSVVVVVLPGVVERSVFLPERVSVGVVSSSSSSDVTVVGWKYAMAAGTLGVDDVSSLALLLRALVPPLGARNDTPGAVSSFHDFVMTDGRLEAKRGQS